MIVSTSTLRFLALATLAFSAGATSSIRGNTKQAQESSPQNRDLMEIDMNVDVNRMECKEDTTPGSDGSIVCTFRIEPPTPTVDVKTTLYNCMSTSKTNFCLKTDVSQVMYNEVPPEALVPATPVTLPETPPQEPQQPVLVNPTIVGSVGTCPVQQQNTGLGCSQYIPSGKVQTLCVYGQTRCECKLFNNDPSIAVGWKCYVSQNPGAALPPPKPNPPASSSNGSFSAFQCRPVGSGCSDSHPIPSNCLGTPACCPNNIIEDWTTNANTCRHNSNNNNNLSRPPVNNVPVSQPPANTVTTVTATATTYQEGTLDFTIDNDPSCPDSEVFTGDSCNLNYLILCYYRRTTGVYMGCACPKNGGTWQCNQRG